MFQKAEAGMAFTDRGVLKLSKTACQRAQYESIAFIEIDGLVQFTFLIDR